MDGWIMFEFRRTVVLLIQRWVVAGCRTHLVLSLARPFYASAQLLSPNRCRTPVLLCDMVRCCASVHAV